MEACPNSADTVPGHLVGLVTGGAEAVEAFLGPKTTRQPPQFPERRVLFSTKQTLPTCDRSLGGNEVVLISIVDPLNSHSSTSSGSTGTVEESRKDFFSHLVGRKV